jgi:hypothetical protein
MIGMVWAAALATQLGTSTLSPSAQYDLTCAAETYWGKSAAKDQKSEDNLFATLAFYIGRLDVRDPKVQWMQIAVQQNKSEQHDISWHNRTLISCAQTMAERMSNAARE